MISGVFHLSYYPCTPILIPRMLSHVPLCLLKSLYSYFPCFFLRSENSIVNLLGTDILLGGRPLVSILMFFNSAVWLCYAFHNDFVYEYSKKCIHFIWRLVVNMVPFSYYFNVLFQQDFRVYPLFHSQYWQWSFSFSTSSSLFHCLCPIFVCQEKLSIILICPETQDFFLMCSFWLFQ